MNDAATAAAPKRRWGRIVAIGLGALLFLLVAAWAALSLAFPPERLAALLVTQVKAVTGRDFRVDGELSIRILPTIAVEAGDVVLGNADWGSRPEMLRIRSASFELSPRALLSGELRVLRVEVAGVDALLETDGAGRANWQLASRSAAPAGTAPPDADKGRGTSIELDHVLASDLRLSYRPGGQATPHVLRIESLELRKQGERDRIVAAIALGGQRWKVDGLIGRSTLFLAGREDWPFELQLGTDGATLAATGTLGTGPRTGTIAADVTAKVSTAAALLPLGEAASAVPLPLDLRANLRWSDDTLRAEPLRLLLAGQAIDGRATLGVLQARPHLEAELTARTIDVAKLRGSGPAGKTPPTAARTSGPLFDDTPLFAFESAPPLEMKVGLSIKQLNVPGMPPLSALRARLVATTDRWTLDELQFGLAGGRVRGRLAIAPGAKPKVELSLEAKALSLEALDAASGGKRLRGGRTDLVANLASTGRTPRSLAAGANGHLLISVGEAMLASGTAAALDRNVIASVLRLVLPKGSGDRPLAMKCAVARLPFRQGIAAVDRSIALETRELAIVASGDINLVDQTLRLEFQPTVRKGLGLNSGNFAELVRVSGPLQDPHAGVDVKGAVRSAATVGVAVATSGLSLLAPIALGNVSEAAPCGQATAAPAKSATASKKLHFPRLR